MKKRFGSALRYQLWSSFRPLWIYYPLMVVAGIALTVAARCFAPEGYVRSSGVELVSLLLLLVLGCFAFQERFFLFLQNGFSRRTLVVSFWMTALVLCFTMALLDTVLWAGFSLWSPVNSLFQRVYAARGYEVNALAFFLTVVWNWMAYLMAYLLGLLLGNLYYRMNRTASLWVLIGVAGLLLLGVPMLDYIAFQGGLGEQMYRLYEGLMYGGTGVFCPWCGIQSMAAGALLLAVLMLPLAWRTQLRRSS